MEHLAIKSKLKKFKVPFLVKKKDHHSMIKWTKEEDEKLLAIIADNKAEKIKWNKVGEAFENKTTKQCYARYRQINPDLNKGKWTEVEQNTLFDLITKHGTNWSKIASIMKQRSGKQIRNHYYTCIKTCHYTPEEDEKIRQLFLKYGTKFSLIAKEFKGKTPESIKQRFYSTIKKQINGNVNSEQSQQSTLSNNMNISNSNVLSEDVIETNVNKNIYNSDDTNNNFVQRSKNNKNSSSSDGSDPNYTKSKLIL